MCHRAMILNLYNKWIVDYIIDATFEIVDCGDRPQAIAEKGEFGEVE